MNDNMQLWPDGRLAVTISMQLYEEGAGRRRMMSISLHDRISGHTGRVRVLDRFLTWARRQPHVWWARREEIADWALASPEITPTITRRPAEESGLPGRSSQAQEQ
jgi:hypothetical protein